MILLATVKESFSIRGRATTLVLELARTDWQFRVGDEVELRTPEGGKIKSRIKGFSHINCGYHQPHSGYGIQLEDPEPQVPIGTVVWLLPKE